MRQTVIAFMVFLMLVPLGLLRAEIIEEIYAIVNDQIITATELKAFEQAMLADLQKQYEGEKLTEAISGMKKNLLNLLIEQKLVQSKLKEKNYNVDAEVESYIQEIKKQNNITTDDEFRAALKESGIEYNTFKQQLRDRQKFMRLQYDEVGAKIKIDNSQIMDYYRKHPEEFTVPQEISLNCVFIKKDDKNEQKAKEKMEQVANELKSSDWAAVAKKYSELPGAENGAFLGKFKKGELNKELEEAALKLKKGESSGWIETDKGWYILQLVERTEPRLREYREVREDIERRLREQLGGEKMKDYIQQLKKDSYIKILKEYNG